MKRQPIPAIITLYILSYAFMWASVAKGNIAIFDEGMIIAHLFGGLSVVILLNEIIQRKLIKQPVMKKLFEYRLLK